jgi:hypothetical protein
MTTPIKLFYSYSHKDEALRDDLETHLANLKNQGIIEGWHDRKILPGKEWAGDIDENLEKAQVILLLISADFLASDYCQKKEMARAIERHRAGDACVIPILLRPVDWDGAPFAHIQALPRDARPVTKWTDRDEAWADVAKGIRRAIEGMRARPLAATPAQKAAPAAPPRSWGSARLTGAEIDELAGALVSAFPTRPALARMLRVRLDRNLDEIAATTNLRDTVFELVTTAEAQGFVSDLFAAALAEVPKNAALLAIAGKRGG